MMNNIAYLPGEARSVESVFLGVSVLLVSNDQGQYYVPSVGVNSIDAAGGMMSGKGYQVFLSGSDSEELVYGFESDGPRTSNLYSYDLESTQSQVYADMITKTGISDPIIITSIIGDVRVGDEIVAYANGEVVGASRIADLDSPVVISGWEGYDSYDVTLPGFNIGDVIDIRYYSVSKGDEIVVSKELSSNYYGENIFSHGNITIDESSTVPSGFDVSENYPNPFNPNTSISVVIPSEGIVALHVFEVTGRMVAELVNESLVPYDP
jgi:hypothetical protein